MQEQRKEMLEKAIQVHKEKEENGYNLLLNRYGNVDAVNGLPRGWHITKLTVTQIKKMGIPFYKACTGFESSGYSFAPPKPVMKNIIPDDFSDKEKAYQERLKEKKNKAEQKIQDLQGDALSVAQS